MARDDNPWKRLRDKEEEESSTNPASGGKPISRPTGVSEIDLLSGQILPMIEQVNGLYNMFVAGVETKPPLEKQKQLEKLIKSLHDEPKTTPALRFRATSVISSFMVHKDKWERLLKDIESGKVLRRNPRKS
jgi:hypothetical protein